MPAETKDKQNQRRSPRRWRRLVLAAVLLAVATPMVAYHYLTDPERVRLAAETHLQAYTVGTVKVTSAAFTWSEGISLSDVTITEPGDILSQEAFHCRRLDLVLDTSALLTGDLSVRSIVAIEPTCRIVRDQRTGKTNLDGLFRLPPSDVESKTPTLPVVELREARVNVARRDASGETPVAELKLALRAAPNATAPSVYDLFWRGGRAQAASGRSQIDLATGQVRNVEGGLPWMSIEAVMIAVNTGYNAAGLWSDLLGLDGTVRVTDYDFDGTSESDYLRSATIELSDASISIPLTDDERDLPLDQRYLRFNHVHGALQVTAEDIRADFRAMFHGAACHLRGLMRGGVSKFESLDDVDFEVDLQIDGLTIPRVDETAPPAERRFVHRWERLGKFYNNYKPSGICNLSIVVARQAGVDAPVVVDRVAAELIDVRATVRWFPYPAENIRGVVEYTPEGVYLKGLSGTHGDADIQLDGALDRPSFCSPGWLAISGQHVPLDDVLIKAMPPRYHMLLDRFQPSGRTDLDVLLRRPECNEQGKTRWDADGVLTLDGAHVCFDAFPHPLEDATGSVIIDDDFVELQDVVCRLGDGEAHLDGIVMFEGKDLDEVDLRVEVAEATLTESLLAAMPRGAERTLRAYQVAGAFDAAVDIHYDAESNALRHHTRAALRGCRVTPPSLPITATDTVGSVEITNDYVRLSDVAGRFEDAIVSADGLVCLSPECSATSLDVSAQQLLLSPAFRAALSAEYREALAGWQIDGPIDATALVLTRPGSSAPTLDYATARLTGGTVGHARLSRSLEDVAGVMRIRDDIVVFEDVEARWGPARLQLAADIDLANPAGRSGSLSLNAVGLPLDDDLRHLLPPPAMRVWDRLRPSGTVDVTLLPLRFSPKSEGDGLMWSVDTKVNLHDVALANMADAKGISGTLAAGGNLVDREDGLWLTGSLDLDRLSAYRHELESLTGQWVAVRTRAGEGRIDVTDLAGRVYEGTVGGDVAVQFDSHAARYEASVMVHQMAVAPFVDASRSTRSASDTPMDLAGQASAQFQIQGVFGDPRTRQGRGRAAIEEGQMYKLPLLLAILHVINLSVPQEDAFQDAKADFFVDGNQLRFHHLELHGDALELVGTGSLSLPDRGLDLVLYSVSPKKSPIDAVLTPLSREVLELHVTGSLTGPKVRARFLPSVTDEIRQLFQKRKPRQGRK